MITLCLPTRGRPNSMERLCESIIDTVENIGNIEVMFYIDNDDDASMGKYAGLATWQIEGHPRALLEIGAVINEPIVLSETWNRCMHVGKGPIFMVCADDIVFESKGWDKKVIEEFDKYQDKIVLVYGDDGGKGERLATHPFIHKNWIDAVGYLMPPYFKFCMGDKWLFELANNIKRCVYLPDVITAHWNCTNRKYCPSGEPDKTWVEMQAKGLEQDYRGEFHNRGRERILDSAKLLEFIYKEFKRLHQID